MIRGFDPGAESFLASLRVFERRLTDAQAQVSSGLRVSKPSDSPRDATAILRLRADLEWTAQSRSNLGRVQTELETADKVLEQAGQVMDDLLAIATDGASTTADSKRGILAQQVEGLQQQLVGLTRVSVEGRYIFSGDSDLQPPYQFNPAAPNGVDRLVTGSATRQVSDTNGTWFSAGKTAQEIFDARNPDDTASANNIFAAVNRLRLALATDDRDAVAASLAALRAASQYLRQQVGFYGATLRQINSAIDLAHKFELEGKAALSERQDADLPAVISEMNTASTNREAALAAASRFRKSSLFDYLG